ncbi:hypothetical protein TrLO_g15197 [Triparma laevis f. longispina]|uniref:Kinesin-like protein n=1 Tax=Triparma laevis f. longispina TaxID=1714387 RepID=A0A9W7KXQ3_9STRA|nr:hypothetical protein TrLO_g15197 [Triparma laevis f. longispina]
MPAQHSVKVCVRVRPLPPGRSTRSCILTPNSTTLTLTDPTAHMASSAVLGAYADVEGKQEAYQRQYCYDHVYPPDCPQANVNETIGVSVLKNSWDGRNTCVFAYGQTGSGKTWTMLGEEGGLVKFILDGLWRAKEDVEVEQRETTPMDLTSFSLGCSYIEIYNGQVKDLISNTSPLKVREHPALGAYAEGLSVVHVQSNNDVVSLMRSGNAARSTRSTKANKRSSRSHAVFTIVFEQVTVREGGEGGEVRKRSKINLVDLAGSERVKNTGATGDGLLEANHINKSLSALGDVIKSLAKAKTSNQTALTAFVPYRNSVLTYLLKESLGGNSVTFMLACVNPAVESFEETLSTLKYADSAKKMVTTVTVNESVKKGKTNGEVAKLMMEVERLQQEKEEMLQIFQEVIATPGGHIGNQEQQQMDQPPTQPQQQEMMIMNQDQLSTQQQQYVSIQTPARKARPNHSDLPIPVLVNLNPDPMFTEKIRYELIPGVTTVGSYETNDVVLNGESVQDRHAVVSYEPQTGLLMIANFGSAVTWINGDKVPVKQEGETFTVTLKDGFRIGFGRQHIFRIELNGEEIKADYEFAMREMELKGWGAFGKGGGGGGGEGMDSSMINSSVINDMGTVLDVVKLAQEEEEVYQEQQRMRMVLRGGGGGGGGGGAGGEGLPKEFEEMFREMEVPSPTMQDQQQQQPPETSDDSSDTVPYNTSHGQSPKDQPKPAATDEILNTINSKLADFDQQLARVNEEEERVKTDLLRVGVKTPVQGLRGGGRPPPSGGSGSRGGGTYQNPDHDSPFSIYGYNPAAVARAQGGGVGGGTPGARDTSRSDSELEFMEYERAVQQQRASPTGSEAITVVLNADGVREELNRSFVDKSRAAIDSLRREIRNSPDSFDNMIDEIMGSDSPVAKAMEIMKSPPSIVDAGGGRGAENDSDNSNNNNNKTPVVIKTAEVKREEARKRMRQRQKMRTGGK